MTPIISSTPSNLTRKWRCKEFETIIGQELVVRMLKNSLYKNILFPVYLLSGQKGCGKTSTARILATAINCSQLSLFQKNPREHKIPCSQCNSCTMMAHGTHPDFIEIDAASHTGVDHVRTIIESSTLLPVIGIKRIYLIDEAHMLSKAAFNAFLKIMEEPPVSTLFMLATTDPQKILETVRSRSFQLHFGPVNQSALCNYLESVCMQEGIKYTREGLELIARQCQGSVRDALNLIEQIRFGYAIVNANAIKQSLAYVDDQALFDLFKSILSGKVKQVLSILQTSAFTNAKPEYIWQRMVEIGRAILHTHYKLSLKDGLDQSQLEYIAHNYTAHAVHQILMNLYEHELTLYKSTAQIPLLELIFVNCARKNQKNSDDSGSAPAHANIPVAFDDQEYDTEMQDDSNLPELDEAASQPETGWNLFIKKLDDLKEPLISSIFAQSVHEHNKASGTLKLLLPANSTFFKTWLEETYNIWHPHMQSYIGTVNNITFDFSLQQPNQVTPKTNTPLEIKSAEKPLKSLSPQAPVTFSGNNFKPKSSGWSSKKIDFNPRFGKKIDVSDINLWPQANLVLQVFPGTVTHAHEPIS